MALTDNLKGYWKLDESSGNATDSISSVSAVNSNATYSSGKINNGANYNGTDAKHITSQVSLISTTAYSISFWLKTSYTGSIAKQAITQDNTTYSRRLYQIAVINSSIRFVRFGETDNIITNFTTSGANVSDGNWHLIQCIFNGSGSKVYIDNTERGSDSVSTNNNTESTELSFGANADTASTSEFLACSLDEIGIWDKELSSDERTELYNSGNGLQYPFTTTSIKSINGLAYSSVKSYNGLAKASIKSINGLE